MQSYFGQKVQTFRGLEFGWLSISSTFTPIFMFVGPGQRTGRLLVGRGAMDGPKKIIPFRVDDLGVALFQETFIRVMDIHDICLRLWIVWDIMEHSGILGDVMRCCGIMGRGT